MPVTDAPADRTEWLEWRRQGIGASDIAKAASGRYGGMWAVVRDKIDPQPEASNAAMERGQRWEEAITSAAEHLLGLAVVGEQMRVTHPDHPTHLATLDGLLVPAGIVDPSIDDVVGVLEVKTHGRNVRPAWDYWSPQVQWQMWCTGLDLAVVVSVEIDDAEDAALAVRVTRIERDEFGIDGLVLLADEIERHISNGTYPDPPASALEMVRSASIEQYTPDAETVDLSTLADDIERMQAIKESIKTVEDERDALQAKIIAAMGAATVGTCGGIRVSLSKPRSVLTKAAEARLLDMRPDLGVQTLDRSRAKAEVPELYNSMCEPVGARTLTIRTPK